MVQGGPARCKDQRICGRDAIGSHSSSGGQLLCMNVADWPMELTQHAQARDARFTFVVGWLQVGRDQRRYAPMPMNPVSSRSHGAKLADSGCNSELSESLQEFLRSTRADSMPTSTCCI